MKKLKKRNKQLIQVSKWQGQNVGPGSWTPEPTVLFQSPAALRTVFLHPGVHQALTMGFMMNNLTRL